jgi:hypothetical protein
MLGVLPPSWVRGGRPREESGDERGEIRVKKLFVLLVLGVAGFVLWRKVESGKAAEHDSWAGVTDPVR